MNCDSHEFVTFSTCLGTGEVMAQCVNCNAFGVIEHPTFDEWTTAVSNVRVSDDRVTIKRAHATPHVERLPFTKENGDC